MRATRVAPRFILGCVLLAITVPASAQTTPPADPQDTTTASPPAAQGDQQRPNPPAAVGEEGKKPTGDESTKPARGFFSALGHNVLDDMKHVPTGHNAMFIAAGAAGALAIHQRDTSINRHLVGSNLADAVFAPGKYIGSTEVILGSAAAVYVIGRRRHQSHLQHLGMDAIEATLLAEGVTQSLKFIVRRDRPPDINGIASSSKTYSFPSGHATLTFAAATVLQQHLGYRAGLPTYLVATWVAMSRLHDNRHYASDVVFGAATGIVLGRAVTWHGRNFYGSPMLIPHGAGIMVSVDPAGLRHQ